MKIVVEAERCRLVAGVVELLGEGDIVVGVVDPAVIENRAKVSMNAGASLMIGPSSQPYRHQPEDVGIDLGIEPGRANGDSPFHAYPSEQVPADERVHS